MTREYGCRHGALKHLRAGLLERLDGLGVEVVDDDTVAGLDEVASHVGAHVAEADEADRRAGRAHVAAESVCPEHVCSGSEENLVISKPGSISSAHTTHLAIPHWRERARRITCDKLLLICCVHSHVGGRAMCGG